MDSEEISPGWRFYNEFKAEHSSKFNAAKEDPDPYFALQCFARELSASGRKRDDIIGVFSAAHAFYMRTGATEDTVADVMDGIANTFGRESQKNLNLPPEPFPADIRHLNVIQKDGKTISAQLLVWAKSPDSTELVKVSLAFPGKKFETTAGDFSSALTILRQRLEGSDLLLQSSGQLP